MSLFDDIQAVGGEIFGSYFLDAQLHRSAKDTSGRVIKPIVWTDYPCKVQCDSFDLTTKTDVVPDKAIRLLVLQAGLAIRPGQDDELTVSGRRWRLGRAKADPANIGWEFAAVPAVVGA